jgi:hypothetical protein
MGEPVNTAPLDGIEAALSYGIGDLTVLALLFRFGILLAALVAIWFVVEVFVVWRKMHKGETLWSALAKWGSMRTFKEEVAAVEKAVPEAIAEMEAEATTVTERAPQVAAIVEKELPAIVATATTLAAELTKPDPGSETAPEQETETTPTPALTIAAPVPASTKSVNGPIAAVASGLLNRMLGIDHGGVVQSDAAVGQSVAMQNAPDGVDMVADMYAMKAGLIALLREHRDSEQATGGQIGLRALEVLIADIEQTEVQTIWMMGSNKLTGGSPAQTPASPSAPAPAPAPAPALAPEAQAASIPVSTPSPAPSTSAGASSTPPAEEVASVNAVDTVEPASDTVTLSATPAAS